MHCAPKGPPQDPGLRLGRRDVPVHAARAAKSACHALLQPLRAGYAQALCGGWQDLTNANRTTDAGPGATANRKCGRASAALDRQPEEKLHQQGALDGQPEAVASHEIGGNMAGS